MRGLLNLVAKEWRDVRALTAASAVLVVAACLAVRWYLEERYGLSMADFPSSPRHFEIFVPACAALYATLIAADIVGGEVASRRIDLVELLPAGRGRVWAAKALFLLLASAGFTVWCTVVQTGVLTAIDGQQFADPFVGQALGSPWFLGLVATFAGATLLVSTIGLRGLAAALVGGVVALSLWIGAQVFVKFLGYGSFAGDGSGPGAWTSVANQRETIAALWLPPVVLAAAGLAYRFGRVHLGKVVRPASIAFGILFAALAGPGAALAYEALTVVPGRPGTAFSQAWPSPDGRFVALEYRKQRPSFAAKVFVLDTERGVLVEPEVGNCFVEVAPWTFDGVWDADGSLLVTSPSVSGIECSSIDPATGAVRRAETLDHAAFAERSRRRYEPWNESMRWRSVINTRVDDGFPTFRVTVQDALSTDLREFRTWAPASNPYPYRRLLYFPEPCVLAVRLLPDGEERRLLVSQQPWPGANLHYSAAPDGRSILIELEGRWKALDLETGATTDVPPCVDRPQWWYVYGGPARRIVVLLPRRNAPTVELVDLDSGARAEVPSHDIGAPRVLADGRLVVMRNDQVLELWDRDLKFVRRLWPIAKE